MVSRDQLKALLVEKAQKKGAVTYDDLLGFLPDPERDLALLDNIMDDLAQAGVEVEPADTLEQTPHIYVANITREIISLLNLDPEFIFQLTPEAFELLICDRLEAMTYKVVRVTEDANTKDGGIDIIAYTSHLIVPRLIAIQVKHHKTPSKKTGAMVVRELKGVVNDMPYLQSGLVVTNTAFTKGAVWDAKHSRKVMALRDWKDLSRWIRNDFSGESMLRELPVELEIGNGIVIPRSRFARTPKV
jgi:hypothetical protein